jgi:hypothetical protein
MIVQFRHYKNKKLYWILHDDVIDVDYECKCTIYTDGSKIFCRSQKDFWGFTSYWQEVLHRLGLKIGTKRFKPEACKETEERKGSSVLFLML